MWFSGPSWCNNYTTDSRFHFCKMRIILCSGLCVDCSYYIRQRMVILVRKWKHIILTWLRNKLAMASTRKCAASPLCVSLHPPWISNYMYPAKLSFNTLFFEMSHWKCNLPCQWRMVHGGSRGCHMDIRNCTGEVLSTEHGSGKSCFHALHALSIFLHLLYLHGYLIIHISSRISCQNHAFCFGSRWQNSRWSDSYFSSPDPLWLWLSCSLHSSFPRLASPHLGIDSYQQLFFLSPSWCMSGFRSEK